MPKAKVLTPTEKQQVADQYRAGDTSQQDLGIIFGVSTTTIRRVLYEHGLCQFNTEVTHKERSFLESIKAMHIETVEQLRDVLRKGLQC